MVKHRCNLLGAKGGNCPIQYFQVGESGNEWFMGMNGPLTIYRVSTIMEIMEKSGTFIILEKSWKNQAIL